MGGRGGAEGKVLPLLMVGEKDWREVSISVYT